jgi:hypothetical protein
MYVLLTQRKLKPGSYDAWRKAWWPEDLPADAGPSGKAYIVRNVDDENDIIAFGMFESDPRAMFSDPKLQEVQANRVAGMAPHIDAIGPDGLYEVIEVVEGG